MGSNRGIAREHAERLAGDTHSPELWSRAVAAERAMQLMEKSLSWRLTKPLRLIKALTKRLLPARTSRSPTLEDVIFVPLDAPARALAPTLLSLPDHHLEWRYSDATTMAHARAWVARHTRARAGLPKLSVLMPIHNPVLAELAAAIASVCEQTHSDWELCITDDGSTTTGGLDLATEIAAHDDRIRLAAHSANLGIAKATMTCFRMASAEYVAFMDQDDQLEPHALRVITERFASERALDMIYSDETLMDDGSRPFGYLNKPAWSPQRLRGVMYTGHLLAVRHALLDAVGGLDPRYDTVQDFELALRLGEQTSEIAHVPQALYRWRLTGRSTTGRDAGTGYGRVDRRQASAVQAHLERLGVAGRAEPVPNKHHRTRIVPIDGTVSARLDAIVVGDAALAASTVSDLESMTNVIRSIEVMSGDDAPLRALEALRNSRARELVLVVSAGIGLRESRSLAVLDLQARMTDAGIVFPMVVGQEDKVLHAGWMIESSPPDICPAYAGFRVDSGGYAGELVCAREIAVAVSDIALLRSAFVRTARIPRAYQTLRYLVADLSLQAYRSGHPAIIDPTSRAVDSFVSPPSRSSHLTDHLLLVDRWRDLLARGDPYSPFPRVRRLKDESDAGVEAA